MSSVLLIEDDAKIRKFLRISLEANDFTVAEARLGRDGIEQCAAAEPDVVVLDLGLPDMDGREVIERLREWSSVPIVVLSVRADEGEKVGALDAGANDYVTKPFSITELMARLRVMLRSASTRELESTHYRLGALDVDLVKRRVARDGKELHLSRKEYDLLRLLVSQAGRVLTHQQILREIWGPAHGEDTHYLRVLIGNLRQKLGDEPSKPTYIHTVQGVGYRLSES
jgi:two-component system KDP operon response regulator KdpE